MELIEDPYGTYGYEFDQYNSQPFDLTKPPPRDPNWTSPVPVVRKYLNRIQKDFIKEDFKELKETSIYLLEVHVGYIELEKDENLLPKEELKIQVKLPTLEFVDIGCERVVESKGSIGTHSSERSCLVNNLFHSIHTETRYLQSLDTEPTDLGRMDTKMGYDKGEEDASKDMLEQLQTESMSNKSTRDILRIEINRGKGVLLTLTGLEMIQSLQQYPIIIRAGVVSGEVSRDLIGEAQTTVILPEDFRQAVLEASRPEACLPTLTTSSKCYSLLNGSAFKVGEVSLTMSLTCHGCAVVNCLKKDTSESYDFSHTMALRTLFRSKSQQSCDLTFLPTINGLSSHLSKTSEEILQNCNDPDKLCLPTEANPKKCDWYKMAQDIMPDRQPSITNLEENSSIELDALWRAHTRQCRQLIEQKCERRRLSVLERLDSLLLKNDINSLEKPFSNSRQIPRTQSGGSQNSRHSSMGSSKEL